MKLERIQIAAVCLLVLASGCSNDEIPAFPVQGRVVFADGSPVKVGTVELKSREHGIQARGDIATDGAFQLTTYQENDGAVAGKHDCVVIQMVMVEQLKNFTPSAEGFVNPRYGSYSTSKLECEVSAEEENVITIELEAFYPEGQPSKPAAHNHQHDHTGKSE